MRTEAIGVNYIDVYHRTGLYPLPSPIPLGQEGAGYIEHLGPGVTTMRVGDLVAWSGVVGPTPPTWWIWSAWSFGLKRLHMDGVMFPI